MYRTPTVDSDIHVHSIKVEPQWVQCQLTKMDQLHRMRKDSGGLFKEKPRIASNQLAGLTRSSGRVGWEDDSIFPQPMSHSVEKPRHHIRGFSDNSSPVVVRGCRVLNWEVRMKTVFYKLSGHIGARTPEVSSKRKSLKGSCFDVAGSNRGYVGISVAEHNLTLFEKM